MANEAVPLHLPGDEITCHAGAAVTGKRFVKISGARVNDCYRVAPCTAAARAVGVASRDMASGSKVMCFTEGIIPVTVGTGGVTAGQEVESDGTGQAITLASGKSLGVAMDDAAAGADCPIKLNL
jgi:predicted RecA/RadA family phage recombinase